MTPAQWIAIALSLAQQATELALKIKSQSGLSDDQLRAQIASDDQATRESIDKFLAGLK